MNLFWKKAFGGLKSTEKLENEEVALLLEYKRYCEVEASEELKEYTELFHIVKSAAFKEKKKTLENRRFKDTQEYRDFKKYQKLHQNSKIRLYYDVLESDELKDFLAFRETEDYEKLGKPRLVKKDPVLKKYALYDRSKYYKTYTRYHNSFIISEYEKLKELVNTEEFQKAKAWWEDEDRWLKTDECKQEQRYNELQKTPDIYFYESTDPKKFEKIGEWTLTFEDNFESNALDTNKWEHGYYHKAASLKKMYSFFNEKQAYSTENVVVENNTLKLLTLNKKQDGAAWEPKKGFVTKEFDFTSGIINTGKSFSQKYGQIKAKLKISGSDNLNHAFWLGADGKLPHVNVFMYNAKNILVNNYAQEGSSATVIKETIKGISPSDYYIYTLEWTPTELVWKIDNMVVSKTTRAVPQEEMFLSLSSFIKEDQKGGQGSLDVDWIRVYTK